jgi:polysaccharide pyruvyl transferase WcaK-like protein
MPKNPARIALFGIFGVQNIGNECTLQAVAHNIRRRLPNSQLYTICYEPEDTRRRHGLPAVAISARHSAGGASRSARVGRLRRIARKVFVRGPAEILEWARAIRVLRGTDLVAMTGTGMLTDYSTSAFGYPYDIWKWATAAKLAGCKIRFVGVGVGPLYERLSRWFVRSALSAADYRSYRDELSRSRLESVGFNAAQDPVFPDLAFSLPEELFPNGTSRARQRTVVGVGVVNYFDKHTIGEGRREAAYRKYVETTATFVASLVEHGYRVRILQGDMRYDATVRGDLRRSLSERGVEYGPSGILDDDIESVEDLASQIATTDLVVSPRFHNLILALIMAKPVAAISYDPKSDVLLERFGLGKYAQPIDAVDAGVLIHHVSELDRCREALRPRLCKQAREYRALLDDQYRHLLRGLY